MTPFLNDDEKERQIIDLYFNQGKNTREIAKLLRTSLSTIAPIIKKEKERRAVSSNVHNGDAKTRSQSEYQRQQQDRTISTPSSLSLSPAEVDKLSDRQKAAIAYGLYDQGKTPVQVATTLYLLESDMSSYS
jgi:DNA-directed RNA polymerase specialized sigma subunit